MKKMKRKKLKKSSIGLALWANILFVVREIIRNVLAGAELGVLIPNIVVLGFSINALIAYKRYISED